MQQEEVEIIEESAESILLLEEAVGLVEEVEVVPEPLRRVPTEVEQERRQPMQHGRGEKTILRLHQPPPMRAIIPLVDEDAVSLKLSLARRQRTYSTCSIRSGELYRKEGFLTFLGGARTRWRSHAKDLVRPDLPQ